MSVSPVPAAVVGWTGLGRNLRRAERAGTGAIVAANTLSVVQVKRV
ncbi:hypothetical protein ACWD0J_12705 [Streptomyces sp. NPDC003011]